MLNGINHITFAVTDLEKSFDFYFLVLGMKPEVKWDSGAYFSSGNSWICLSLDKVSPAKDYTHVSFSVPASKFNEYCAHLISAGIETWKENKSEGKSLYFFDPDGHKLEIHVGNLQSRLEELKLKPYSGLRWY